MSEIKIDLNGMSLLDVIKAYPEQVLQAIEQHNEEAQKTPTNNRSDGIPHNCKTCHHRNILTPVAICNYGYTFGTEKCAELRIMR